MEMTFLPPLATIEPGPAAQPVAEVPVAPDASPLDFLCAVYRDSGQPMSRRMRAAIEALPFTSPKLSATALLGGGDFGALLEERLKRRKMIEVGAAEQAAS